MTRKHHKDVRTDKYPEFMVRTHHVWIIAVLLVALCVTFFWLGRWYQRKVGQYYPGASVEQYDTTAHVESDLAANPEDMEQRITFFDRLESDGTSASPSKKSFKAPPEKAPDKQKQTQPKKKVPAKVEPQGSFYTVQVLAGNQKSKALKDSETLEKMGFLSYIQEEHRPSGTLYKVRVGKFSSKEKATEVGAQLKKKGYQTWILKVD
jgi:cell division septation protein DedD